MLLHRRLELVARIGRDVPLGPDLDRVVLQRRFLVEDERQYFVVDGDQPHGVFGDVAVHGRDGGNRLADVAHRVVERVTPLRRDLLDVVVVLDAARDRAGAPDVVAVLVRDDCLDAGQRARLREIDGFDARVRMGAAQHLRVQHPV